MPFADLRKLAYSLFGPALTLRAFFPRETRQLVQRNLVLAALFLFVIAFALYALGHVPAGQLPGLSFLVSLSGKVYGLFLLAFAAAFMFSAVEAFHRSYYFRGLGQVLSESADIPTAVSWEVATIVYGTGDNDVTRPFLESPYGQEILYRAGIHADAFQTFFASRSTTVTPGAFIVERDKGITLEMYTRSIYKYDEELRQFLAQNNVNGDQFALSARWVTAIERGERLAARWWSRDNLGRIPGIGKTWGYGETYLLDRYGHDLTQDHVWAGALMNRHVEADEVEEIETILARQRQSNALVLGDDAMGIRERVAQLYHKIREGRILPPLEAKRVYILDIETMLQTVPDKSAFEQELRRTLDQACSAGNIILYIESFWADVVSARTLGTDLVDILLPYFEAKTIQIVVASSLNEFHKHIAKDKRIMEAFDKVHMYSVSNDVLLGILEQRALERERQTNVVFTVPALQAVARLADRYFPAGIMPDKAFDLLEELVPIAIQQHMEQLLQGDVERLVAEKSGVPIGEPTKEERETLLSLEDYLHKRVVGQDEAVNAVARALRRARAGVASEKRPMGSFLFLGPTGVGKTETAKALAEVLFHDENAMIRLDMSEYQGSGALDRLIGDAKTGEPGRLATLVRDQQYGVLLLDELEKADRDVHDLLLQVLDEGYFTDA